MRRTILLAGVLLGGVALGSDSPKETHDSAAHADIEGTWQATGIVVNGQNYNLTSQYALTNSKGHYVFLRSERSSGQGKYRINPTRQPPHLDRIPSSGRYQGQTFKFIYRIDGDSLWVAHIAIGAPEERQRPLSFDDDGVYIETYKRVK